MSASPASPENTHQPASTSYSSHQPRTHPTTSISPTNFHKQQNVLNHSVSRSSIASSSYYDSESDIFTRGQAFLQAKAHKISQLESQQHEKDLRNLKFHPEITKKAHELVGDYGFRAGGTSYYSYSEQWKEKVNSHVLQKKQQLEEEELRKLEANKTGLNKKSKYIIQKNLKQKKYRNPIEGWNERFEQFQKHRMEQSKLADEFKPRINKKSVSLKRRGSIYSRLHQEARQKEKKLLSRREHRRAQEMYDTNTGQPLFTPQINDKPSNGRHSAGNDKEVVYKQLHSRAAVLQKKRDELAKSTPPDTTFKPKLDPKSLEIANSLFRKPLYSPRSARDSRGDVFHTSSPQQNGDDASEQRRRNASKERLSLSGESRSFLVAQYQQDSPPTEASEQSQMEAAAQIEQFLHRRKLHEQMKQKRLRRLQERKFSEEMKECTFKPSLNKKSRRMMDDHVRNLREQRRDRLRDLKESFGVGEAGSFSKHYVHENYSDSELTSDSPRRRSFDVERRGESTRDGQQAASAYGYADERNRRGMEDFHARFAWSDNDSHDHDDDLSPHHGASPPTRRQGSSESFEPGRVNVDNYVDRMVKDAWNDVVGGIPSPQLHHRDNVNADSSDEEPEFRSLGTKYELDNEDHVLDTIQSDLDSAFSDWTSLVQQGGR